MIVREGENAFYSKRSSIKYVDTHANKNELKKMSEIVMLSMTTVRERERERKILMKVSIFNLLAEIFDPATPA